MKVFLDTNILIDYLCRRPNFFDDAALIVGMCQKGIINGMVSALTIINTMYIARKFYSQEALYEKLDWMLGQFQITPIDHKVLAEASQGKPTDFEDNVQYQSALLGGAGHIITRDRKGFLGLALPIYTPSQFLDKCREE